MMAPALWAGHRGTESSNPFPPAKSQQQTRVGHTPQFATRIEGTCVKHRFGKSSIKHLRQTRTRLAYRDPPPTTSPLSSTNPKNRDRANALAEAVLKELGLGKNECDRLQERAGRATDCSVNAGPASGGPE
jgi:hypothetical protein